MPKVPVTKSSDRPLVLRPPKYDEAYIAAKKDTLKKVASHRFRHSG